MDCFQFVAAIVQSLVSLAWPAAFVIAILIFRERLNALLPLLQMKYKDFDIRFRLDEAEKVAVQIPTPPPSPETEQTPEERSRFERVASESPRAAILEKRAELEQVLVSAAEPYLTGSDMRNWKNVPLVVAIRVLRKHQFIDAQTSALLDDLRVIGNRAAHASNSEEFTKEDAMRFGKLADSTIELIGRVQHEVAPPI